MDVVREREHHAEVRREPEDRWTQSGQERRMSGSSCAVGRKTCLSIAVLVRRGAVTVGSIGANVDIAVRARNGPGMLRGKQAQRE